MPEPTTDNATEFEYHFVAIGEHGQAITGKTSGPSPIPGEDTIARVRLTLQARQAKRFAFLPGGMGDDGWFEVPTEYVGPLPEPRLLDCGFCYEEQGEEVHPHPECPLGSGSTPVSPSVEIINALSSRVDELPERPTVFAGGRDSRLLINGNLYAVSSDHPVVLDPFGPDTPGGLLTLTLACDRITIDGKEVGNV